MKKIALLFPLLCITAIFTACGADKTAKDTFDLPAVLDAPDSIAIDQILAPQIWRIAGDKALILSQKTDSAFFVYRLPDFKYLYSFGAKGEGPDDFSYPYLRTQDVASSPLYLEDMAKGTQYGYHIGDQNAQRTGKQKGKLYNILFYINDSIAFQTTADFSGEFFKGKYRTIATTGDNPTIDSLVPLTYFKSMKVSHFENGGFGVSGRYYNDPQFVYNNGRLVMLYGDVRRTDVYDISPEGKITLKQSFGDPSTSEQINAMDLENTQRGEAYYGIQGTENYIYVLSGDYRKEKDGRKLLKSYVEVYDWEGNPVKKFDLGRAFSRFLVDEPHGKIFCYDGSQDFEQVFVYDYKI